MATIKDVARLAGVGLGTASRVVSGKGSVAPATAQRVQKAIEQLNFRPSHAALAGDAVDNVPGVPGIGPKTAKVIISDANSLVAGKNVLEM